MLKMILRDYFEQMTTLVEAGEYAAAIQGLNHVLQHYPRFVAGYLLLGHALVGAGDYQEAARQFRRVLGTDPESVSACIGMSRVFQQTQNWDKAVRLLQQANDLSPQDPALRQEYAQLNRARGDNTAPAFEMTLSALGRIYFTNRLYAKSIRELQSVLTAAPDRIDVQVTLAHVLWQDGQQLQAVQLCHTILGQRPLALKPNLILAAAWLDSPQPHEAAPYLELAHSLDPLGVVSNEFVPDNAWWTKNAGISLPDDMQPDSSPPATAVRDGPSSWQEVEQMSDRNRDDYEVPDWLSGVGDELLGDDEPAAPTPPAEASDGDSLPDWLQSLVTRGEEVEESFPLGEPHEYPEPEEESTVVISPTAEEAADEPSDLPDWLSDIRAGLPEETPGSTVQPVMATLEAEVDRSGLPDWLQDTETPEIAAASRDEEEMLPEWLQDTEDVDTTPASPEIAQLPEWLREEETVTADTSLPPWLQQTATEEQEDLESLDLEEIESLAGPVPIEDSAFADESEIPLWLTGEAGPTSVRLPAASELDLQTAGIASEADDEVPDWLRELQEPAGPAPQSPIVRQQSEITEDTATGEEDAEIPVWMRQMQADAPDEAVEEEDVSEALLSETAWAAVEEAEVGEESLRELEFEVDEHLTEETVLDDLWDEALPQAEDAVSDQETAPAGMDEEVFVVPEAPGAGIDVVEAALEREARDAVEIAELPKDAAERLQVARQAVTAGNWSQALIVYDSLVGSSELLDKVIDDLEVHVRSHPDDASAYQVLGDAYMKDGRLPLALKTYRQALAKLYQ